MSSPNLNTQPHQPMLAQSSSSQDLQRYNPNLVVAPGPVNLQEAGLYFMNACIHETIDQGTFGKFLNAQYTLNGLPNVKIPKPSLKVLEYFFNNSGFPTR